MCGIAGWFLPAGVARDRDDLRKMADAIAHRGPDDRGEHFDADGRLALAHLRLSIIDLSAAGHQPMFARDGSVVLSFNGELYNYVTLRQELETLGRQFHTRTDTEVMLQALEHWGADALARFNGMFALAAWFPREQKLLLARDPLGMKPLYYTSRAMRGGVAFASELKAFVALEDFRPEVDPTSLRQFLEFGYVFEASDTMLCGVSKLPPGHALEIRQGRAGTPYPFYVAPHPQAADSSTGALDAAADELHEILSKVVGEHLVADVPVGLLLSGGLDSSVVAALAARHSRVTTISMGFADSAIDERPYARTVARHIGSEHHEVLIHDREVLENLEETVWYFDDLFADWGTVSTRLLYRKCREMGAKVVLVGEGSDELFGGYTMFEAAANSRGPQAWQLFQLYRRYAGRRYGGLYPRFARLMRGYQSERGGNLFEAVRMFESRHQLPSNYVMKVDKASMSVSVEARAPFLDRRVASFAYRQPQSHLIGAGGNKLVLRRMAERQRLLPEEITARPKFGASIAASWMDQSTDLRGYAQSVILAREGWTRRLGLQGAMADFFDRHKSGYAFPHPISLFSNLAWRLLLLELWARRYRLG